MASSSNFPMGMRFVPKDEELIVGYLLKKIHSQPIPLDGIAAVNLYDYNPQTLTEKHPPLGDREWYFFTPRDRKYPNGTRPNRVAGTGYWKATASDKQILSDNEKLVVGFKKVLVFYEGEPKKGKKTNWIMHEYRVDQPTRTKTSADDMRLDDWVLCRVYERVVKAQDKKEGGNVDQNQVTTSHEEQVGEDNHDEAGNDEDDNEETELTI